MALTQKGSVGNITITGDEWDDLYDLIGGITAGTQVASKAVFADANVNIGSTKVTALYIGTSGSETQVTATAAELNFTDVTAGTATASKAVVLDASKNIATIGTIGCGAVTSTGASTFASITLNGQSGAASSGLLLGIGDSTTPATTAVADKKFFSMYTQSTATSGDSRGLYWRHELNGAGNSGESIRAFTKVKLAAANARGIHTSLDLDATGSVTGLGVGLDAQLSVGNAALSAGTYAIINAEMYAGGASTDITGTTQTSVMRVTFGGNATGVGKFNDAAFFLDLTGVLAASGDFIDTDKTALTGYGSMRVKCPDGVTRYIPITTGS